jgi:hypothetical protein
MSLKRTILHAEKERYLQLGMNLSILNIRLDLFFENFKCDLLLFASAFYECLAIVTSGETVD